METNIKDSDDDRAISMPEPISLDARLLELEASLITWALEVSRGNKSRAAALLQIKRSTFGDRIKHCGLDRASAPHVRRDAGDSGAAL